jgi:predicted dehydrogenase
VDIANARITFSSGCVANITASRVTGKTMQKIRFFGLEGYHAVDYEKRELISLSKRAGADGKIEIYGNPVEIKLRDPLEEEIRAFLDSVISRKPPPVSGKDGRDALELAILIAEKARKAQETLP